MNLLRTIFAITLTLFIGCSPKDSGTHSDKLPDVISDPEKTFDFYKEQVPSTRDSVYGYIFSSLAYDEKYDLLENHLGFYQKIKCNSSYSEANIGLSKGWIYINKAQFDSSEFSFNKTAYIYLEIGEIDKAAFSYYGLGVCYFYLAEYEKSVTAYYKSIDLYKSLNNTSEENRIKIAIASTLIREKDYAKAIGLCNEVLPFFLNKSDYHNKSYIYSLMMQAHYHQKEYDSALQFANLSLDDALKTSNQIKISGSYNNLATLYLELKDWYKALSSFEQSKKWLEAANNKQEILIVEANIANCLWSLGEKNKAQHLVLNIINTAKISGRKDLLLHSYDMLYKMEKETGDYQKALQYYELSNNISDSIFNDEKHKIIQELNVRYETSQKEHTIIQMKAEQKAASTQKIILGLVLAVITISGAMIVLVLVGKNKRHKLSLKNKQLEMEGYKKDLAAFAERILHKNKLIEKLREKTEIPLQESSESDLSVVDNNIELQHLSDLYQLQILTDADWQQFKLLFDKAFPGMIARLRNQWQDITAAEERQFLLIKLNISNKECANMLGISLPSIKKNRYRLKKRFGLSEEQDLDEFVKQFE